ncbi:alpha/beta hydrolase family protein [Actinoplanes sp. L3-i22]|uniref:alpha/beta hydrolase family protein n=1 Tax=Actinoplanes sp. L3-i22 TaxID=2836373 RepID=UPI001C78B419|nr:alpha/beta hydrolase family protein [Actinoplanes sp. L3-i22]BCY13448.1 thioesterase [Actinoplanes sp. L3-i22]
MSGDLRLAPAGFAGSVRPVVLNADGQPVSGLFIQPETEVPRSLVLALHGAGTSAAYFHGQAHGGLSFLDLAARFGHSVLAIDRPGYGRSSTWLPLGLAAGDQAAVITSVLSDVTAHFPIGAGVFLLAHSFGGKVALHLAGDKAIDELLGADISGCGHQYAVAPARPGAGGGQSARNWGPLRLYPSGTFSANARMFSTAPAREAADALRWPEHFADLAGRIEVPIRLTFAEHEAWWRCDAAALADLHTRLSRAPRVVIDQQPAAGHNVSLGWAAQAYHLRVLAFLEDCLLRREHEPVGGLVT